jgi:hypothetical protein
MRLWRRYKPKHGNHKHEFVALGTTIVGWTVLECSCGELSLA